VQRYLGQVGASLAGAGLSGVIGYFIAVNSTGGSHAAWPYGPLLGAIFLGGALFYYHDRKSLRSPATRDNLPRGHVFISYAREDFRKVENLQRRLEAAGFRVWRDKTNIWPGQDWREEIRKAISNDTLAFVACFSRNSLNRPRGYVDDELALATEQLAQRNPTLPWLFPVRFNDCVLPDLKIGPTRTLNSLQRADLFGIQREDELERLIDAIRTILNAPNNVAARSDRPQRRLGGRFATPFKGARLAIFSGVAVLAATVMALVGATNSFNAKSVSTTHLPAGISVALSLALDNTNYCKWEFGSRPIPLVKVHPLTIRIDNRCLIPAHPDAASDIPTSIFANATETSQQVGNVVDGQTLPVTCWEMGQEVSVPMAIGSTLRSDLWLEVALPSDVSGYIPDVRTGGGYTVEQLSGLGIRQCGG
jgi:hypothetical protein